MQTGLPICLGCLFAALKRQLRTKLDRPVASDCGGHIAEIACCVRAKALIRLIELRCIRHAERFGAKLHTNALFDRETAEYRGVQIEESWSAEGSARFVAEDTSRCLAKWASALRHVVDDVAGRHIEPWRGVRAGHANSMKYCERAGQVRRLGVPGRVQS